MNQTSAVVTGGVALSTATVMPAVEWVFGLMTKTPVPASVSALVAGLVVAGVHAVGNYLAARSAAKQNPAA
jgi:hypothetical protein